MFRFLPEQGSDFAHKVDELNYWITDISVFFTVVIVGAMIYFAIRYRKRNGVNHPTPRIEGSLPLEILWTVVPTIICIFVAAYGYIVFDEMRKPPDNALQIDVIGQKWWWDFRYSNGKSIPNEFYVPVDTPIKLIITSRDVLHSFFIPVMRTKIDAVPGQFTYQWFRPVKTGTYTVFCTEYCGDNHSAMLAKVHVVSQAEYQRWFNDRSAEEREAGLKSNPAAYGRILYKKSGCNSCHSLNGAPGAGPSWLQLYNRSEEMVDGSKKVADENYIKDAIFDPAKDVVKGYAAMPQSFKGILSDEDVAALTAFIKTLDKAPEGEPAVEVVKALTPEELAKLTPIQRGEHLYKEKICNTCHSLDGSKIVGPSFKGLYGKSESLEGGASATVDDAYIMESLRAPNAKVVLGYPPAMPPFGPEQIKDEQVADIIEYLKTLK